jgi:hypothetical protein
MEVANSAYQPNVVAKHCGLLHTGAPALCPGSHPRLRGSVSVIGAREQQQQTAQHTGQSRSQVATNAYGCTRAAMNLCRGDKATTLGIIINIEEHTAIANAARSKREREFCYNEAPERPNQPNVGTGTQSTSRQSNCVPPDPCSSQQGTYRHTRLRNMQACTRHRANIARPV